jgi:hypothetical protein
MSSRVLTLVGDRFPGGGSELMAMLFLADWGNDDGGSLYPSISFLAAKMRVSESQARRVLHGLIDGGYVAVVGNEFGGAPGMSRNYQLNVDKLRALPVLPKIFQHYERNNSRRKGARVSTNSSQLEHTTGRMEATPSADATPSTVARDGSQGCAGRVAPMRETGGIGASLTTMNHQRSTKEPSDSAQSPKGGGSRNRLVTIEQLVDEGVDREHATDWLMIRKAKKSPLTPTAWNGIKREAEKAGLSFAQAVEMAAERGWVAFRETFVREQSRNAPKANHSPGFGPVNHREASRAAAAASIGLGVTSYDNEPFTVDTEFKRIA